MSYIPKVLKKNLAFHRILKYNSDNIKKITFHDHCIVLVLNDGKKLNFYYDIDLVNPVMDSNSVTSQILLYLVNYNVNNVTDINIFLPDVTAKTLQNITLFPKLEKIYIEYCNIKNNMKLEQIMQKISNLHQVESISFEMISEEEIIKNYFPIAVEDGFAIKYSRV